MMFRKAALWALYFGWFCICLPVLTWLGLSTFGVDWSIWRVVVIYAGIYALLITYFMIDYLVQRGAGDSVRAEESNSA